MQAIDEILNTPFPSDGATIEEVLAFQGKLNLAAAAVVRGARDHIDKQHARIAALEDALRWFSNMLDGREGLPLTDRTEVTYGELWKARNALYGDNDDDRTEDDDAGKRRE